MGIGTALNTSVLGLKAQSTALEANSQNIANAETTGYKRMRTAFDEIVTAEQGQGVNAVQTRAVTEQGALQSTSGATDFAVDGEGFMIVGDQPNDNLTQLTRAGSFEPDSDGNLRNEQGKYLKGVSLRNLPPGAGPGQYPELAADNLEPVNISGINYKPDPTNNISFKGNLPVDGGGPHTTDITYTTEAGGTSSFTFEWSTTGNPDEYDLTITNNANGTNEGTATVEFNNDGSLNQITGLPDNQLDDPTGGDGTIRLQPSNATNQEIDIDLGIPGNFDGVTYLDGDYTVTDVQSDGGAFSTVQQVQLDDAGVLKAVFQNGKTQPLYQIPVGTVDSPNNLQAVGGQAFQAVPESGQIVLNEAGDGAGQLESKALEASNVDLSAQLTDLIPTQRTYAANGSAVRTADQMLQRTIQLKQ